MFDCFYVSVGICLLLWVTSKGSASQAFESVTYQQKVMLMEVTV